MAQQKVQNTGVSEDTKTLVTVLALLFAYPVGVFVMWFWTDWPRWVKILLGLPILLVILLIAGLLFVGILAGTMSSKDASGSARPSVYQTIAPSPLTPAR